MLSRAEIICFAATKNPDIAKRFYTEALGLKLVEDSPFALLFDVNGTMLRIQKVTELVPAKHTTLGWHVENIRAEIIELNKKGIQCERYERLSQDELGIWQSPSGAQIAWFLDPDGNGLSLTQFPT